VCTSADRERVEAALLEGEPISTISTEFEVSVSSLRRHRDAHLLVTQAEVNAVGLVPVEILTRLHAVADRLHEQADLAEQAGRTQDLVRSVDAERRALVAILDVSGVTHESILHDLALGNIVVRAVGRLARRRPDLGELVADELDALDERALALDLRATIHNSTRRKALS
jgi:hypothetical protein